MTHNLISGKTITELYKYLQHNGGSYNDLRNCFRNASISPSTNINSTSTRNKGSGRMANDIIQVVETVIRENA